MAKRTNRSQSSGRSRTPDIPNMREQRHEIAAKYYLACRQSNSNQNNDVLGKGATYINAINLKVNKDQIGSLRTVYGSVIKFEIDQELGDYFIPAAGTVVNNMFFVVWLDNTGVSPKNYITLNDKIVLETDNLGFTKDNHIDISESNNSLGGEVFLTDYNIPPVYFMIKDMLDNYGITDKYTTAFDISQHTLNTDLPINQMVFKRLYQTGALNGLATGSYAYSYRLVSTSGDKSNWSPATPLIQVPDKPMYYPLSETVVDGTKEGSREYNERLASGQLPADINISQCGCELWLRIDNRLGYNEVEVSRTEYNVGAGLGTTGVTVLIQKILIQPGDFFILVIKDDKSTQTSDTIISIDEESSINSIIKRAKTIRYFNNKVQLGNIEYEDTSGKNDVTINTDFDGDRFLPLTHYNHRRQVYGMLDEQFRTYNKSLMDEESYGFAIVAWGDSMSRINVIEPDELKSTRMPSRDTIKTRKQRALSFNSSFDGDSLFMENTKGSVGNILQSSYLYEADNFDEAIFDNYAHQERQTYTGDVTGWEAQPDIDKLKIKQNISNQDSFVKKVFPGGVDPQTYKSSEVGLKLREPKKAKDEKVYEFNNVFKISKKDNFYALPLSSTRYIEPFSKNPYMRTLCLGITNLTVNSNNVKAISVVRTKPAGRVVMQGLGSYSIQSGKEADSFIWKKKLNCITLMCPDDWILDENLISILSSNPERFRVKISRPQMMTTEVMAVSKPPLGGSGTRHARNVSDILCHAYYGVDNPYGEAGFNTSTGYTPYMGVPVDYFQPSLRGNGNDSEDIGGGAFGGWYLEKFSVNNEQEGVSTFELQLADPFNIYKTESSPVTFGSQAEAMLEPVYIVNIIDEGALVSNSDFKEYYESSQLIKMESVVEIISNSRDYSSYRIYGVDEREEDYHVSKIATTDYDDIISYDRYISVRREGKIYLLWNINGFLKGNNTDTLSALQGDIENGTTDFRGVVLHGVYASSRDENGDLYIILEPSSIENESLSPPIDIPLSATLYFDYKPGDEIIVKFDNTKPVKCFGDNYIGASCLLQLNRGSVWKEDDEINESPVVINASFPYASFRLPTNLLMNYMDDSVFGIWGNIVAVRQMAWRFFCKSKSSIVLTDGESFPNTQYKARVMPESELGDAFNPGAYAHLYPEYLELFPGEFERWQYGGFNPNKLKYNIDYSKTNENYKYASFKDRRPSLQTENKNLYPTRVVWSLTRPIQSYYSSGLRTFRPFAYKDLDDKNSQIIKLFNHISNSGENLMAFTEEALYLLLTNKRILTGAADEVVTTSIDETDYIPQIVQVPSQSNSGLPFGFEGTFAEGANCVCWANDSGVYLLKNGSVFPLHGNAYLYVLGFIKAGKEAGTKFVSYLNAASDEYYLSYTAKSGSPPEEPPVEGEEGEEPPVEEEPLLIKGLMFSIADDKREYVSTITFKYSLFLVQKNMEHGIVKLENKCYIESLDDTGDQVALGIFEAQLYDAVSEVDSSFFHKEYIDVQVNSSREPTVVNTGGGLVAPFKYRGSWWARVSRSNKQRYQSTAFDYMIEFFIRDRTDPERTYDDAVLNGFILHYKNLK